MLTKIVSPVWLRIIWLLILTGSITNQQIGKAE